METPKAKKPIQTAIGKGIDPKTRVSSKRKSEYLSYVSHLPANVNKEYFLTDEQKFLYLVSKDLFNKLSMITMLRKETQDIFQLITANTESLKKKDKQCATVVNGTDHTKLDSLSGLMFRFSEDLIYCVIFVFKSHYKINHLLVNISLTIYSYSAKKPTLFVNGFDIS